MSKCILMNIKGVKIIKVYWDEDELSCNAYQICVD